MRRFLRDERGQGTVEFGMMLLVYVTIILGLLVVNEMGLCAKAVLNEARIVAWNSVTTDSVDLPLVRQRLEERGVGTVSRCELELLDIPDESVRDLDMDDPAAQYVFTNCLRRVRSTVGFDYRPPWQLMKDDFSGSEPSMWYVERQHEVCTRGMTTYGPRILPPRNPGPGRSPGNENPRREPDDPPRDPAPPQPPPIP